jgi:hypothetical protein
VKGGTRDENAIADLQTHTHTHNGPFLVPQLTEGTDLKETMYLMRVWSLLPSPSVIVSKVVHVRISLSHARARTHAHIRTRARVPL